MTTLPKTYQKIQITKISPDFRNSSKIVTVPLNDPKEDEVIVKNLFLGINASDVNFSSGKYIPGIKVPFDCGFESIGKIVKVGSKVSLKVGQPVAITGYNCFSEYMTLGWKQVNPVPFATPEVLPIMVSGLTASIALEKVGELVKGETVLVTAAAGSTGIFAVQFAKLAGCHVIGTCSSDEKCQFLKSIGCDRAINYVKEDLNKVLKSEYPKGVDVVYESVGGQTFDICVDNLAVKGRVIIIGFIAGYKDGSGWKETDTQKSKTPLSVKLLGKSASVRGFFLNNYMEEWKKHLMKITKLVQEKKIIVEVDKGKFYGLETVSDAIDHLLSGKNIGKVYVSLEKQSKL